MIFTKIKQLLSKIYRRFKPDLVAEAKERWRHRMIAEIELFHKRTIAETKLTEMLSKRKKNDKSD